MCKNLKTAATLILAAKSNSASSILYNYKLLCMKRSSKSKFMPNTYVFPGGKTSLSDESNKWLKIFEKSDYNTESFTQLYPKENIPPILLHNKANVLPKYMSLRICAIRETFEECGILICRSHKNKYCNELNWASVLESSEILKWQTKVNDNSEEFLNLCEELDVYPDMWALHIWSNWTTPPSYGARFDTIFFISAFQQTPETHANKEVSDIKWVTPEESIINDSCKSMLLPNPQYYEVSRLKNFKDLEGLLQYSSQRSICGCEKYFPYVVATHEGFYYIFPGDELYPDFIDTDNKDVTEIYKLPETKIKNRLLVQDNYIKKLFVENFVPKDGHLPPKLN